jgi:hypothetical protein
MNLKRAMAIGLLWLPMAAFAAEPAADAAEANPPAASKPGDTKPASAAPSADATQRPEGKSSAKGDRLELDTSVVSGNRELPKVLYIVPWKKADIGDLPAQPFNTLLDEALTPVDRDVFRREVTYYGAMSSGADGKTPASATPAAGPEK